MIVIVIIMVLALVALPNVIGAAQTEPLMQATNDIIDYVTFARTRAANDSRATGILIDRDANNGQISMHQGFGPECASIDWAVAMREAIDFQNDEVFGDMGGSGPDVRIIGVTPDIERICFRPDGRTLDANTNEPIAPLLGVNYAAGEVVVSIVRHTDDKIDGMIHHVIIPYSGRPRFTFSTKMSELNTSAGEGGT